MESKQKTSIITKMMNNGNGILQKTNIDPKVKVGGHFNTSLPPIHNSRHQIHSSLPLKLKRTSKEDILLKASTQTSSFRLEDSHNSHGMHETEIEINNIEFKSSVLLDDYIDEDENNGVNIIFKKNKVNEIQFMSVDLLLKKIAFDDPIIENNFIIAFLSQYTLFIKTEVLVQKIVTLYDYSSEYPRALVKFINNLVLSRYQDEINPNDKIKDSLKSLYEKLQNNEETYIYYHKLELDTIIDIFTQESKYDIEYTIKHAIGRKKSSGVISFKEDSHVHKEKSDFFDVLEWDEKDIARQLTLISHKLFSKVELKELMSTSWTKKNKNATSSNVMSVIYRFNKLSMWVVEEVVSYDKKRMRAQVIEKFVKVAVECRNINNFNDCMNILIGLNNFIIKNLVKTWKIVNKDVSSIIAELNELCSFNNNSNFTTMRNKMKSCIGKPCVPYLGLLLKELAFIEEGPKYVKSDSLVNLEKISNVAKTIDFFFQFKSQAYLFKPIDELSLLSDFNPKTEDEIEVLANKIGIYNLYNYIEPVFILSKTKSTKKRITNTDSKMYKLKPTSHQEFLFNSGVNKKIQSFLIEEDHF